MFDFTFLFFVIGFGVGFIFAIWARSIAIRKERSPIFWFLAGFLTFFVAVVVVYLLPTIHPYTKVEDSGQQRVSGEDESLRMVMLAQGKAGGRQSNQPARPRGPLLAKCQVCGVGVPDGALACGTCGAPL